MTRGAVAFWTVSAALATAAPLAAQEPLWDGLQDRIKSEAMSLGALLQVVADVQGERTFPGRDGFSVANFRFSLYGSLDGGVDYLLQSNFGDLLDARIGFRVLPSIRLDVGRFKAPYSREFLTGAGSIDFVNRAQVVSSLVPGRALGMALQAASTEGPSFGLGLFNGGGGVGGNARGRFRAVARAGWSRDGTEVAVNAAWNGDRVAFEAGDPSLDHLRGLIGADTRMVRGPWLFSGELDLGLGATPEVQDSPWGGFLTVGRHVHPNSQLLLRLEHLDTGERADTRRTLLIAGWNLWPTSVTELQLNGVVPLEGFGGEPQLLVNVQLAL